MHSEAKVEWAKMSRGLSGSAHSTGKGHFHPGKLWLPPFPFLFEMEAQMNDMR